VSYARFAEDSDVYVYLHVDGWLECCFCSLGPDSFKAHSTQEMVDHLGGHPRVPEDVIPALWADDVESFPPDGGSPSNTLEGRHG